MTRTVLSHAEIIVPLLAVKTQPLQAEVAAGNFTLRFKGTVEFAEGETATT